ncbi:MAG TPA: choice-of-anchor tandem repeat GloVer-containing protein [Rhizomicrobium sp.]|nr:choice-of-anchor tandem repeat GloVer-containing protein [Rhizomicrobium sp.]
MADPAGNLYGATWLGGGTYELTIEGRKTKLQVIHRFPGIAAGNLITDTNGNLYGTTLYGGKAKRGTVFELSPQKGGKGWKLTNLYQFCPNGSSCSHGDESATGLTYAGAAAGELYDGSSPLYGTTLLGGTHNGGAVFELWPPKQGKEWAERVLYNFCSRTNCADGETPSATPIIDQAGNIYGSAVNGGKDGGGGVVYVLSPRVGGESWKEAVIHSFAYGSRPATVLMDSSGDVYGVTVGVTYNRGMFYEIFRSDAKWRFRSLYSFCAFQNCADGAYPIDIVMDSSGDFFGAAMSGGANGQGGAVFEFAPDGSKWKLSVLYSFCSQIDCADGKEPVTVTLGSHGSLYGTTEFGGKHGGEDGAGVAFELKAQ